MKCASCAPKGYEQRGGDVRGIGIATFQRFCCRTSKHTNFFIEAYFSHKLDLKYTCIKVRKSECSDVITMTAKVSKAIADALHKNKDFWDSFNRILIYYDNGQVELTKILTAVFSTLYANIEFRKVSPVGYKLFQVADLVCTLELLAQKASEKRNCKFFKTPAHQRLNSEI